jgi:cytochrome c-type biogenesis protein CcmH/NrfF
MTWIVWILSVSSVFIGKLIFILQKKKKKERKRKERGKKELKQSPMQ